MVLLRLELAPDSFWKHAVVPNQVLNEELFLTHALEAFERACRNVGTCVLECHRVVCLLHLRHVDELAKEILVVSQHLCVLLADAVLDLHVVQVVHVVDKAAASRAWLLAILALNHLRQLF